MLLLVVDRFIGKSISDSLKKSDGWEILVFVGSYFLWKVQRIFIDILKEVEE